jgi:hypothetical protein
MCCSPWHIVSLHCMLVLCVYVVGSVVGLVPCVQNVKVPCLCNLAWRDVRCVSCNPSQVCDIGHDIW